MLHRGGLVAFPTETVYGLGADARNPAAVQRIFAAKGRPSHHPLIVHIADADRLPEWAEVPPVALQLAARFWPGPLALVLRKQASVPPEVTGGQDTVGLRCPDHPVALALLRQFGGGIAAPSANRFCRISPTTAAHVREELGDAVDKVLDGGACTVGLESTILDLSGPTPRLLRPGHIQATALAEVLGIMPVLPTATDGIRAPGMMAVHYAPQTPTFRCPRAELTALTCRLLAQGQRVGALTCQQALSGHPELHIQALSVQPEAYAQMLYAALRELDNLHLDILVVEQPPQTAAWRAINDRLNKAAVDIGNLLTMSGTQNV
jgi:L-threonylcarbamoyladenylate synthase